MADSVTQIRKAGPVGSKRNLAVLGDGFAAGDQTIYNNWVQTNVLDGLFKQDYFYEDASAWNIFRVNLISNEKRRVMLFGSLTAPFISSKSGPMMMS